MQEASLFFFSERMSIKKWKYLDKLSHDYIDIETPYWTWDNLKNKKDTFGQVNLNSGPMLFSIVFLLFFNEKN